MRINDKMNTKINEIIPLLNNNTDDIINKTNIILNSVIPKSQNDSIYKIKDIIESFNDSILKDTHSIMKSTDSQIMKDFVNNFEMKSSIMYQNIQQPLYTFIMALEERINTNINSIKDNIMNNEKQNTKNKIFLNKTPQELIVFILNKIYKTSEIIPFHKKSGISESSNQNDFNIYSLKRINKQSILINNVDLDRNITTEEIESFYKVVDENKSNALFLSQNSGFALKKNYHIEYRNGNILVFIHNVDYQDYKIKIAMDIIDNLSLKLNSYKSEKQEYSIDNSVLEEINNEYKKFINQKESLINTVKENQKNMLSQIDNMNFAYLDDFLSTKFIKSSSGKQKIICDNCNKYHAHNLKALAAHKRGVKRK